MEVKVCFLDAFSFKKEILVAGLTLECLTKNNATKLLWGLLTYCSEELVVSKVWKNHVDNNFSEICATVFGGL